MSTFGSSSGVSVSSDGSSVNYITIVNGGVYRINAYVDFQLNNWQSPTYGLRITDTNSTSASGAAVLAQYTGGSSSAVGATPNPNVVCLNCYVTGTTNAKLYVQLYNGATSGNGIWGNMSIERIA